MKIKLCHDLENFTSEGREKAIFDRLMSSTRNLLRDSLLHIHLAQVTAQDGYSYFYVLFWMPSCTAELLLLGKRQLSQVTYQNTKNFLRAWQRETPVLCLLCLYVCTTIVESIFENKHLTLFHLKTSTRS